MGIPYLTKFVKDNNFFENYHLKNSVLIIDGPNLMVIFNENFKNKRNDHFFGGDYNHFAHDVRQLFATFKCCNVTPIIIWESKTTYEDQMNKKLSRLNGPYLENDSSKQTESSTTEKVFIKQKSPSSVLWAKVFIDVLYDLEVEQLVASNEADDLIAKKALELHAPILSNDSDFFFLDLSAGVISVDSVLQNFKKVPTDREVYIVCKRFIVDQFELKFLGLKRQLLPIVATPMLDCFSESMLVKLTKKDGKISKIFSFFKWLSNQSSVEKVIETLNDTFENDIELTNLIEKITKNNLQVNEPKPVKELTGVLATLPLPKYVQEGILGRNLRKRILFIYFNRKDLFYNVVDDPILAESPWLCSFKICHQIYGILRMSENVDDENNKITQYFCNNKENTVSAVFNEKVTNTKLPTIWEIENLSEESRQLFFWNILEIDPQLKESMINILKKHAPYITDDKVVQFCTIFLSLIYFERNLEHELSIEFIYSLLLNIILSGYIGRLHVNKGSNSKLLTIQNVPELVAKYDKVIDLDMKYSFMPRITHYNNAFQCCFENIYFLAQILNIPESWHANELVFGLQSTFVYNLTKDLLKRKAPWEFLKENLKQNSVWPIYKKVVMLAFEYSGRQLDESLAGLKDFPQILTEKKVQTDRPLNQKLFIRKFKKKICFD